MRWRGGTGTVRATVVLHARVTLSSSWLWQMWQSDGKQPVQSHDLPRYMEGQTWAHYETDVTRRAAALPKASTFRLLGEAGTPGDMRPWILREVARRRKMGEQWGITHLDLALNGMQVRVVVCPCRVYRV